MKRSDIGAFIFALAVTVALGWGTVYFVQELWPVLPGWLAMIVFIFLAVAVIGYPIYALAKWSDRYLARTKQAKGKPPAKKNEDSDDWG